MAASTFVSAPGPSLIVSTTSAAIQHKKRAKRKLYFFIPLVMIAFLALAVFGIVYEACFSGVVHRQNIRGGEPRRLAGEGNKIQCEEGKEEGEEADVEGAVGGIAGAVGDLEPEYRTDEERNTGLRDGVPIHLGFGPGGSRQGEWRVERMPSVDGLPSLGVEHRWYTSEELERMESDEDCGRLLLEPELYYSGNYMHHKMQSEEEASEEGMVVVVEHQILGDIESVSVTRTSGGIALQHVDSLENVPETGLVAQAMHCGNGRGAGQMVEAMASALPSLYGPRLIGKGNSLEALTEAMTSAQAELDDTLLAHQETGSRTTASSTTWLFNQDENGKTDGVSVFQTGFVWSGKIDTEERSVQFIDVSGEIVRQEDLERAKTFGAEAIPIQRFGGEYIALDSEEEEKEKRLSLRQFGGQRWGAEAKPTLFLPIPYVPVQAKLEPGNMMLMISEGIVEDVEEIEKKIEQVLSASFQTLNPLSLALDLMAFTEKKPLATGSIVVSRVRHGKAEEKSRKKYFYRTAKYYDDDLEDDVFVPSAPEETA